MARHNVESDIAESLALLEGLRAADGEAAVMPGAIELTPEERVNGFTLELRETTHEGRVMAGPYVQSFYKEGYPTGPELPNWLANIADGTQVTHFLAMHSQVRGMLQESLGVHSAFLGGKHKFAMTVQRLIEQGYITRFTNGHDRNSYLETIMEAGMHIGNLGDTYADGLEGYYDYAGKVMVVAPGIGHDPHDRVVDTQDRIDRILPRVLGGLYGKGAAGWMRTAFGEHLGQVMRQDGFAPATIAPSARGEKERENPFALYQRELLGSLLVRGEGDLGVRFIKAMTSKDSNTPEWAAFRTDFDALWGVEGGFDRVVAYTEAQRVDAAREYPDAVRATHQEMAAKATLDTLRNNPAGLFRPERAKPAVGELALKGDSGRHRLKGRGRHRHRR